MNTTISLTFGDAGENHTGMEMHGALGKIGSGFTCDELKEIGGEYYDLGEDASIVILRDFLSPEEHKTLFHIMNNLEWDKKYYDTRRKRVLNKLARSNIMILDGVEQEPNYEEGKGRVVDGNTLELFPKIKKRLQDIFGPKAKGLICEGNKYENNKKHGIGFHGDTERRKVIALRLGASMPIHWQWYLNSKPIGERFEFNVNGGDVYVMSEKAVGNDWKKKKFPTLRHAAGAVKYIYPKKRT